MRDERGRERRAAGGVGRRRGRALERRTRSATTRRCVAHSELLVDWRRGRARASRCSTSGVAAGRRHATRRAPRPRRRGGRASTSRRQMLERRPPPGRRGRARQRRRSCTATRRCTRSTPGAFDVVISRFGAMFFADPVAAFANVGGAMRPAGALALDRVAGAGPQRVAHRGPRRAWPRDATSRRRPSGMPGPFGFADPDRVRTILGEAGFRDVRDRRGRGPVPASAPTPRTRTGSSKDLGIGARPVAGPRRPTSRRRRSTTCAAVDASRTRAPTASSSARGRG